MNPSGKKQRNEIKDEKYFMISANAEQNNSAENIQVYQGCF